MRFYACSRPTVLVSVTHGARQGARSQDEREHEHLLSPTPDSRGTRSQQKDLAIEIGSLEADPPTTVDLADRITCMHNSIVALYHPHLSSAQLYAMALRLSPRRPTDQVFPVARGLTRRAGGARADAHE